MTLSAGTVSLGVSPVTAGLGAKLASGILGESGALGKVGEELGLKLTAGIGIALVATAGLAVKMASDMQESDAKIQGNAQLTAKSAAAIGDAFLGTAGKSTFTGAEMAKAFAPVAGVIQMISGHTLTAADSMKVMAASTDLAEASGQPLANTTADLAAVMQSFGLKVSDAASTSNTLFNTSRLTDVSLDSLSSTVDRLHGRLGIAAPSLADTSGLMVDLASHGISGSRGVMVVQTALTTLLGGSKATNGELKSLGVNVFNSSGKFVGMQSVLAQLTPKLKGMSDSQRTAAETALFGSSSAAALNSTILAGAKGLGDATAKVVAHGAAENAAAASAETFDGQLKTLKSGFTDILTTLGEKLMPVFMALETWVSKNIPLILTVVAALVAWKVVMLAISAATKAATVIQGLFDIVMAADPIVLVIIAVTALVAGIIYLATKTKFFQTAWSDMTTAISTAWNWLWKSVIKPVGNFMIGLINDVINGINTITSAGAVIGIKVAKIPDIPKLAAGATILPTPGGTIVRVAEGGKAETVVDTGEVNKLIKNANNKSAGGAPTFNIYEAVSARATAAQVVRRQVALGSS